MSTSSEIDVCLDLDVKVENVVPDWLTLVDVSSVRGGFGFSLMDIRAWCPVGEHVTGKWSYDKLVAEAKLNLELDLHDLVALMVFFETNPDRWRFDDKVLHSFRSLANDQDGNPYMAHIYKAPRKPVRFGWGYVGGAWNHNQDRALRFRR